MKLSKVLAVDFDKTLCDSNFPECGEPILETIMYVQSRKKQGWKIILWTCRRGSSLKAAIDWCKKYGLTFDAINDNLPEVKKYFDGTDANAPYSPKIYADEYLDDKALTLATIRERIKTNDFYKESVDEGVEIEKAWKLGIHYNTFKTMMDEKFPPMYIHQQYLHSRFDEPDKDGNIYEERIRQIVYPDGKTKYFHTIKKNFGKNKCSEDEKEISKEDFDIFLDACRDGNFMKKFRYKIPYNDHMIEFDHMIDSRGINGVDENRIEVEFEDTKDMKMFKVPEWFGEEIK